MNVLFVSSANKKRKISPFIQTQAVSLINNGIKVDFFTLYQGGVKGYFKNAILLRKHLRQNKYDLIHAHYALTGFISSFARKNEKLVVSLMGDDILGTYKSDGSLDYSDQPIVYGAKFFSKYFWNHVILKSANMVPKLLAGTAYSIVPNGVDLELFKPRDKTKCREELNLDLKTKYILFPTNPDREEKNFPLAKASVDILKRKYSSPVELLIVHKLALSELVKYYNAVDVCIMTSRSEGSPNVIKECMACNLPVVSTDVGDVKEVIKETSGCYISDFIAEIFAENIKRALDFKGNTCGREHINHLEINVIAKKIIEIYKNTLSQK